MLAFNSSDPSDLDHPGDTNPNKVPLRDIMLSLWQAVTKRSVGDLMSFQYWAVVEASMKAAVPQAYQNMGKIRDDQEKVTGQLVVTRKGTEKGEQKSFQLLSKSFTGQTPLAAFYLASWILSASVLTRFSRTENTVFAIGLEKMAAEYAEFNTKEIDSFSIVWDHDEFDVTIELRHK